MELVDSAKKPFVRVNNQSAVAKAMADTPFRKTAPQARAKRVVAYST